MKGTKLLTPGTNVQEQQFCKRYVVLSRNKQASGTCTSKVSILHAQGCCWNKHFKIFCKINGCAFCML